MIKKEQDKALNLFTRLLNLIYKKKLLLLTMKIIIKIMVIIERKLYKNLTS